MSLDRFIGTTVNAILALMDDASSAPPVTSVFFKPYSSPLDVLGRTTSIATDPLLIGAGAGYFALLAAVDLFQTCKHLFKLNTSAAKERLKNAGIQILITAALVVIAVLSPLINLIDLIAGAVNSLRQPKKEAGLQTSMPY